MDTALIFEGGGMRSSYTSAVVVGLLEEGIHLPWVGGVSAGASNLANYLSQDPWRARQSFTDFAADPQFGNWRTFLKGQGLFNADYIYQHTSGPDEALPFDWETFAHNPATFRIGAFDIRTGNTVYWTNRDVPTLQDLMIRVQASSTMPMLMPPVAIDDGLYVDGALGPTGGIPLDAAQADGYQKFLVILSQERTFVKHPHRHLWAVAQRFRRYPAVVKALRERANHYNTTRCRLLELRRQGKAYLFFPRRMFVTTGERDVEKLRAAHTLGLQQVREELPAIKQFLEQD